MKFIYYKKSIVVILIVTICIIVGFKFVVWDNPDSLCEIAESFDDPSTSFYFVLERIYKLSEKNNYSKKIRQYLSEGKNGHLHQIYIRILGVLGERASLHDLLQIYIKYQHDPNQEATIYYVISSMGLIGDKEILPLLETIMEKHDDHKLLVSGSEIASAIYLITGSTDHYFTNSSGKRQRLILTNNLMKAREIILASKGRTRKFEEMIILDNVFRPPTWQKNIGPPTFEENWREKTK